MGACGGGGGVGTRPDRPAGRNLVPESREKVRGKNLGKKFGENISTNITNGAIVLIAFP